MSLLKIKLKDKQKPLIIILLTVIILLLTIIGFLIISKKSPEKTITSKKAQEAETYLTEPSTSFIEGSLGYPSEGIPSDMEICAENLTNKTMYCTTDHLQNNKYTYKVGYKIEVPAGNYYVFARTSWFGEVGYKAYYSSFVSCGMRDKCKSHNPIAITVTKGKAASNIDPIDWYDY